MFKDLFKKKENIKKNAIKILLAIFVIFALFYLFSFFDKPKDCRVYAEEALTYYESNIKPFILTNEINNSFYVTNLNTYLDKSAKFYICFKEEQERTDVNN